MKRRTLLASLGAGLSGLSGCSGLLGNGDGPTPTVTPVTVPATATPTATPTERRDSGPPAVTPAAERCAGPRSSYRLDHPPLDDLPEPRERFVGLPCPTYERADSTICYHNTDIYREGILLAGLQTLATVSRDEGDVVGFLLVNRTELELTIEPSNWSVLQYADGEWHGFEFGETGCVRTLRPNAVHWWEFGLETSVEDSRVNVTAVEMGIHEGTYALAVPVGIPQDRSVVTVAPFHVTWVQSDRKTVEERTPDDEYFDPDRTATPTPTAEELG